MSKHIECPIFGFTDIVGNDKTSSKTQLNGFADIIDISNKKVNNVYINIIEQNQHRKLNENNNNFLLTPVTGVIDDNGIPVADIKVSFIDKNNIVKDYCITNKSGEYYIYIEPGTYTVRIGENSFPNQIFKDGLKFQYFYTVDGLIKKRYNNIVEFYDTEKKLVEGKIINHDNEPLLDGEIIITQNNEIKTYIKTDDDGKYSFAIENGIYDVRVRSKRMTVKIINNVEFIDEKSFIDSINEKYPLFNNGDWLLVGGEN